MTLADTHCHLYLEPFHKDLDDVYKRALAKGVKHIFLPAIDWNSLEQMKRLSHPEIRFYKMVGIHPCNVGENLPINEQRLFELASQEEYVAVGESGLDYYWSTDYVNEQKKSLNLHCKTAKATGKPLILHNRESTEDLLDIMEKEQDGSLEGIWHCFNGTVDEGKRALDLGLHLGIGGVLTFKNAGVDKTVRKLPLEKMILETDAPYLAPEPKRGKRNEPSYVAYTAKKLAEIKEISIEVVAEITTETALNLFGIKS